MVDLDYGLGPIGNKLEQERVADTLRKLMTPCDFQWWASRDAWTAQEAACIIFGVDPPVFLGFAALYWSKQERKILRHGDWVIFDEIVRFPVDKIFQDMVKSHAAGKLPTIGKWADGQTLLAPATVTSWALAKGYQIHDDLACLGEQASPTAEEISADDRVENEKHDLDFANVPDSPEEYVRQMKKNKLDDDEIKYRLYHNALPRWKMRQWQAHCIVEGIPYPLKGSKGEVDRNNHKAAYLRSQKRYLSCTKNTR